VARAALVAQVAHGPAREPPRAREAVVGCAIQRADAIPEHARDQYTRATKIDWDGVPLLGDVIAGTHPGRMSENEIIGLILRGDGVQFTAVGHLIYQRCKEQGFGTEIPTDLFLQDARYIP
jgi:alanine dehydrogenase